MRRGRRKACITVAVQMRGGGEDAEVAAADARSDVLLGHDLVLLGHLDNGLGFYRSSYNGSSRILCPGVIAPGSATGLCRKPSRADAMVICGCSTTTSA